MPSAAAGPVMEKLAPITISAWAPMPVRVSVVSAAMRRNGFIFCLLLL